MKCSPTHHWPEFPPEPILTIHAIARMRERGISLANVRAAIDDPFRVQRSFRDGCFRIDAPALHGNRREWLVVIMSADKRQVVTTYWYSRRRGRDHGRSQHRSEVNHDAA